MEIKNRGTDNSGDKTKIIVDEVEQGNIIATIHVLKNKTQVRKRVVVRHGKESEES